MLLSHHISLILFHKICKSFIENWFISIILVEYHRCELRIKKMEVIKTNNHKMSHTITDFLSQYHIFLLAILFPVLKEFSKLSFDVLDKVLVNFYRVCKRTVCNSSVTVHIIPKYIIQICGSWSMPKQSPIGIRVNNKASSSRCLRWWNNQSKMAISAT